MSDTHPSFLALDRHALGATTPNLAAHLGTCLTCAAYVAAAPSVSPVPAWARDVEPRRTSWLTPLRWFGFAAAVAGVALLGVGVSRTRAPTGDYVGTKGGPGVSLFIKRGDDVHVWNGKEPVVAGDLLRLQVQGAGFAHVDVFEAVPEPPGYARLYEGPLAGKQTLSLPSAWEVDARPGDETLVVVLGAEAIAPSDVAVSSRGDDPKHWVRRLVLSKRAPEKAP
ncbi:MAG: hypothetical protein JWM82_393 [Myxococcales bacterium]|nr:hypothetical protein [Myxococcales bacterium]